MAEKTDAVAVKKPAKNKAAPKVETAETQSIKFTMEAQAETKTYAKFTPPADSGCVGQLYVPKGTKVVKVLIEGPAE